MPGPRNGKRYYLIPSKRKRSTLLNVDALPSCPTSRCRATAGNHITSLDGNPLATLAWSKRQQHIYYPDLKQTQVTNAPPPSAKIPLEETPSSTSGCPRGLAAPLPHPLLLYYQQAPGPESLLVMRARARPSCLKKAASEDSCERAGVEEQRKIGVRTAWQGDTKALE